MERTPVDTIKRSQGEPSIKEEETGARRGNVEQQ